ncbi:DUF11 domain-containing protein [Herbiconiux sp. CPCC 205763]|uniref:DUF11 domain-containing protein n=1 Tax=Herbiconiux aconitum TaxID=2970913 RepID=A0ABT2GXR3_9MICO|nr:DUF11 domain-containing protein [Herbiconiux aconitum]MCS5719731.1 DUF11 domain-containing protein [Herbiconiux aconitum]
MTANQPHRGRTGLELHRAASVAGAGLVLLAGVLGGSAPAFGVPRDPAPTPPQLSISLSDDVDAAASGDELVYTVVVENLGTADAFDLTLTQTVPEGLTFSTADNGGTLSASTVSWTIEVKAAETATLRTTMTVGETPVELLRLATVACALVSPTDPPIVCASDSDILPAGVAAEEAAAAPQQTGGDLAPWLIGASIGVVVVVAAALAFILRRRRAAPPT